MNVRSEIERAVGQTICEIRAASGGDVGQVYLARNSDGQGLAVKVDSGARPRLDIEGFMLNYLHEHTDLPLPAVIYNSPSLLIMSQMPGASVFSPKAEEHAADLLAALHERTAPAYGLHRATLIGGLDQPNPWTDSWVAFFAEHRLLHMAGQATAAGRLPANIARRVRELAMNLPAWIAEPAAPSLLHGDIWRGNVLAQNDQISAFLDPALYYGDPEVELAFITLFNTFGERFFSRYQEKRPLAPGFFDERRHLYNLYPLLVHARLFGGHYVSSVDTVLKKFSH